MNQPRRIRPPARLLRWCSAGAVVAALLAGYWVALDRVATRIGLETEDTLRSLPGSGDSRQADG